MVWKLETSASSFERAAYWIVRAKCRMWQLRLIIKHVSLGELYQEILVAWFIKQ